MSPCNELETRSRTHTPARCLNDESNPPPYPKAFYFKRQHYDLLLLISFEMFSGVQIPAAVHPRQAPDTPPLPPSPTSASHPNAGESSGKETRQKNNCRWRQGQSWRGRGRPVQLKRQRLGNRTSEPPTPRTSTDRDHRQGKPGTRPWSEAKAIHGDEH